MRNICGREIHDRMYIIEQILEFVKQSMVLLQSLQASRLLLLNMTDIRKGVMNFIVETCDHQNSFLLLSNYIIGYPDSPYMGNLSEI